MNEEKQTAPGGSRGGGTGNVGAGSLVSVPIITAPVDFVKKCMHELLTGDDPLQLPADYVGPWADELAALIASHKTGGHVAARKSFDALARRNPALAELVAGDSREKRMMIWNELLTAQFPEPKWVVNKVLPIGLTFLAGRPKVGKSWLALQIAGAVATGGMALGERVERGKVLYLALEDSWTRIRERGKLQRLPADAPVVFADRWEALGEGGLATLQTAMDQERPRLVVLDTFSRVAGRVDQQDVGEMTVILSNLQRVALDRDMAILALDHHRKKGGFEANAIDDVLGSTAKSAVSDAVWGLYREQGDHTATLLVTGRDIEERELALHFDGLTMCWQCEGDAGQVRQDTIRANILRAIRDLNEMGELAGTAAIAEHISANKGTVSHELAELLRLGKVAKAPSVGRVQPYILKDTY